MKVERMVALSVAGGREGWVVWWVMVQASSLFCQGLGTTSKERGEEIAVHACIDRYLSGVPVARGAEEEERELEQEEGGRNGGYKK